MANILSCQVSQCLHLTPSGIWWQYLFIWWTLCCLFLLLCPFLSEANEPPNDKARATVQLAIGEVAECVVCARAWEGDALCPPWSSGLCAGFISGFLTQARKSPHESARRHTHRGKLPHGLLFPVSGVEVGGSEDIWQIGWQIGPVAAQGSGARPSSAPVGI